MALFRVSFSNIQFKMSQKQPHNKTFFIKHKLQ